MKSLESFPERNGGGISREEYEASRFASPAGRLTPVQQKMVAILADNRLHRPDELHDCLEDELGAGKNISPHLTNIRKVLRALGEDIASVRFNGSTYYQKRPLRIEE